MQTLKRNEGYREYCHSTYFDKADQNHRQFHLEELNFVEKTNLKMLKVDAKLNSYSKYFRDYKTLVIPNNLYQQCAILRSEANSISEYKIH